MACRPVLAAVLAAVLLAACQGRDRVPAPSCAEVTDHVIALTSAAYPGHGDMFTSRRLQEIAGCTARQLSADERRCMMRATDLPGLAACRTELERPRPRPRQPAVAPPLPPLPGTKT